MRDAELIDRSAGRPVRYPPSAGRTAAERLLSGLTLRHQLPCHAHTVTRTGERRCEKAGQWFSAENIVAVCTAALGVLASVGVLRYERRVPRRGRIGYRVQSSHDCTTQHDAADRVIRCEPDSTQQVLATVGRLDGAIGYSELCAGTMLSGTHQLSIDPTVPSVDTIGSSFLGNPSRRGGQDVVRTHGHLPCATPKGLSICGEG
jgi:hypothetical protein